MNNRILIMFFLLFFFIPISLLNADINDISEKGYIKVGVYYKDAFPFFFKGKDGNLKGCDIDIAKEIAKELGVGVKFDRSARTFDQLTELIYEKKVDIVISWFSRTLSRARKIRFTSPYFIDNQVILLNRLKTAKFFKKNLLNALNDENITIGTVEGTSYVQFLKKSLPKCKIVLYKNWENCMNDVINGKITAGLWTGIEIFNSLNNSPDISIKVKTYPLKSKDYICIGVNKNDSQLLYWLNLFLKERNYNFTPEILFQKYKHFLLHRE